MTKKTRIRVARIAAGAVIAAGASLTVTGAAQAAGFIGVDADDSSVTVQTGLMDDEPPNPGENPDNPGGEEPPNPGENPDNPGGEEPPNPGENPDNPGGENPGGENPGGENPGGENPGGENPGGENPGGENPGGENPGGENPGGENPGGENPGGENPGGENPGGENPGGENPGGETPGGEVPGEQNPGGATTGGGNGTTGGNGGGSTCTVDLDGAACADNTDTDSVGNQPVEQGKGKDELAETGAAETTFLLVGAATMIAGGIGFRMLPRLAGGNRTAA
ncbi:hypothetical protein ACQSMD_18980 [Streptomyces flavovirens]|uniref:LPXTG cell wall anchor domain-containing protein n=1 Tax=Streptomyces flavovirens TaxID=52258 RepID=UPI003D11CE29